MTQELQTYYEELSNAYDHNQWYYTMNSDRRHNAIIMLVMLEKADKIRMYCGEMSVFRKDFYQEIYKSYPQSAQELMDRMSKALEKFLNRENSHIDIILENFSPELLDDLIVPKRLFMSRLGLDLYFLPDSIGNKKEIPHIAYTDDDRKMVRIETDKKTHEAMCKVGTTDGVVSPSRSFEKLLKLARRVAV